MKEVGVQLDSQMMAGLEVSMWSKNQYNCSTEGRSLRDCVWRMGYSKYRLWKGSVNGNDKNNVRVSRGWVGKAGGDEIEKLRSKGPGVIICSKIIKLCRGSKRERKGNEEE